MRKYTVVTSLFIISIIMTACAASKEAVKPADNSMYGWTTTESQHRQLPSSIGDISIQHEPAFVLPLDFNEGLAGKTEYGEQTNQWFGTGFSISAGKQLPGDQVKVQLNQHTDHLTKRYQLTERNSSFENISLIEEKTTLERHFTVDLPNKEGALYLLSAEVLNEDHKVLDTLISLLEVPPQSMNAQLYTDQAQYRGHDTVILTLENFGPTELYHGTDYYIEQYDHQVWQRLVFENIGFNAIGIRLSPHDTYEHQVRLPDLPEGTYRIVKSFEAEGTQLRATLAAEFKVN